MPVVKADAYGHGAVRVGPAPGGAAARRCLAVAYRRGGRRAAARRASRVPIVVLAAFGPGRWRLLARPRPHARGLHAARRWNGCSLALRAARPPLARPPQGGHRHDAPGLRARRSSSAAAQRAGRGRARRRRGPDDAPGVGRRGRGRRRDASSTASTRRWRDLAAARHPPALGPRGEQRGPRRPAAHATRWRGPGLLLYGLRPRPLAPPVAVRPVMTRLGRRRAGEGRARGHAGLVRRPLGRAAPVADRHGARRATPTACRARDAMSRARRVPGRRTSAPPVAGHASAWTSPWSTSPTIAEPWPRATRPSSSATSPRPGTWPSWAGTNAWAGADGASARASRASTSRRPRVEVRSGAEVAETQGQRSLCASVARGDCRWQATRRIRSTDRLRLPGVRLRELEVARPLPGLRRVEQLRWRSARSRRPRRGPAAPASGRQPADALRRRRTAPRPSASPRASASSTACWAAASCPARWC